REQQLTLYNKHRKSTVRPIIKAQEKLDRLGKKCTRRSGSEVTDARLYEKHRREHDN
ncbi:mitogen-activated protein kinase kinase kinase 12, partial [Biomphalaria glabrata]